MEISSVRAGRPLPSLFDSKRWSCDLLGARLGKLPPGPLYTGKTTDVAMRNTLPCFLCFSFLFCINPWIEDMMSQPSYDYGATKRRSKNQKQMMAKQKDGKSLDPCHWAAALTLECIFLNFMSSK